MLYKRDRFSYIIKIAMDLCALFVFSSLAFILIYIFVNGIPNLKLSLFEPIYSRENSSVIPGILNNILLTVAVWLVSVPIGVGGAIYMTEYARKGSKLVAIARLCVEALRGIPSIVYGLFGNIFFLNFLGWGYSFIRGALTLSIMVLPVIIRTSEEAIVRVPDEIRQASYALGRGKLRTCVKAVLPRAMPGIAGGVILARGRVTGETAALIYTMGTMPCVCDGLFASGRTLSVHLWMLRQEGLHTGRAFATRSVLIFLVIVINSLSGYIAKKASGGENIE